MPASPRFPLLLAAMAVACSDAPTTAPPPGGAAEAPAPLLAVSAASLPVVMSGLDAPRGMAWGPDGGLYVAEAGDGQVRGGCVAVLRGANCWSGSGAVSRLRRGVQERVAEGLPSAYNPDFLDIIGPQDVGFQGLGNTMVTLGWGGPPAARAGLGGQGSALGQLIKLTPSGQWRAVADIAAFEGANNPAGGPLDSNPFGLLIEPGRTLVADAGANSLLEVGANGEVSLVATFPSTPVPPLPFPFPFTQADAVPTEVQRGPDGAVYVSTLGGAPFLVGSSKIFRLGNGGPVEFAGGFKTVTDFAFARAGGMYVVEYATGAFFFSGPGRLLHVAEDGTRTTLVEGLSGPTAVLEGPDGAVYLTNNGNLAGVGQVLRYDP